MKKLLFLLSLLSVAQIYSQMVELDGRYKTVMLNRDVQGLNLGDKIIHIAPDRTKVILRKDENGNFNLHGSYQIIELAKDKSGLAKDDKTIYTYQDTTIILRPEDNDPKDNDTKDNVLAKHIRIQDIQAKAGGPYDIVERQGMGLSLRDILIGLTPSGNKIILKESDIM